MLLQRVLTLRGSARLSEWWEEGGGGADQEAGITEVTPPRFGEMPGLVALRRRPRGGDVINL